jgi:hypothetical protein
MPGTRRWMALGFLLATPVLLAQTSAPAPPAAPTPAPAATSAPAPAAAPTSTATPTPQHKSHKARPPKALVLPPLQSGPLSQLPMDQIPATPAKVSYEGGLLAISAHNSTLSEILRDVRKLTGASIDIPQGASERVVADLGPGAPRDVLALLLNGTSFNYVMLGSNSDPKAVSSVILMLKPSAADTQTAASGNPGTAPSNGVPPVQPFNRQPNIPPPPRGAGNAQMAQDDDKDEDQDNAEDNAEDQAQPQPAQPVQPAQPSAQDQQQQTQPGQPNAGPKTPEQILEELRRQQQSGGAMVNPTPQQPQQPPPPQE